MSTMGPFITIAVLLLLGVLIFKIGLLVTKANIKTNAKWVFGSFFIQFGLIFFISTPLILAGAIGAFEQGVDQGPDDGLIAATIIFSAFIDVQVVNVIHKIGIKRSLVVVILIIIPITIAMVTLGQNMDKIIDLL